MTVEDMTREMNRQAAHIAEASTAGNLIGILEDALSKITTDAVKPDLSHVTSLA
ncbi:hypothetical protein [Fibrobacter sp.]|uniref:hypothetical protein n=1 Tax=Fibrobacter sp. TaxID=35828 RepID=UPI0038906706